MKNCFTTETQRTRRKSLREKWLPSSRSPKCSPGALRVSCGEGATVRLVVGVLCALCVLWWNGVKQGMTLRGMPRQGAAQMHPAGEEENMKSRWSERGTDLCGIKEAQGDPPTADQDGHHWWTSHQCHTVWCIGSTKVNGVCQDYFRIMRGPNNAKCKEYG